MPSPTSTPLAQALTTARYLYLELVVRGTRLLWLLP